jgi:signal transduction histidine kinase
MRSPVYSDLLLMGCTARSPDEQRADLERVQRSQRHLLALVDNVLDFATLGSRRVRYETADVDVAALVADVQASISAELAAKRLRLEGAAVDPALVARADPASCVRSCSSCSRTR